MADLKMVNCVCGASFKISNRHNHNSTQKHKNFINGMNNNNSDILKNKFIILINEMLDDKQLTLKIMNGINKL